MLPVFSASGNFGLHYAPLPEFLALGEDKQIFMELTKAEVRSCQGRVRFVCPPSKAIYRKNKKKTCAMALFLQDPAKKKEEFDKMMVKWRGLEAVCLGHRRWALSLDRPRSLIMSWAHVSCQRQMLRRSILSKFRQDDQYKLTNGFFRKIVQACFLQGMTAFYFRS